MARYREYVSGVAAFTLWGFFPLYWRELAHVAAEEILAHRILWSCLVVTLLLVVRGELHELRKLIHWPVMRVGLMTGALISANWLMYIYAVNSDQTLEASLGYFLNPLVSITLGVVVLNERLRRLQRYAVLLAVASVGNLFVLYGTVPWIALGLSSTFALYGLLRKRAPFGPLAGLWLETLLMAPWACYVIGRSAEGEAGGAWGSDVVTTILLSMGGVVTAVPLLLFAVAARALPLTSVGILTYISPLLQFLVAVLVIGEPLSLMKFLSFCLVWLALVLFSVDLVRHSRADRALLDGAIR